MTYLELGILLALIFVSLFYIIVARREIYSAIYGKEDWEERFHRQRRRRRRSILILSMLTLGLVILGLSVEPRKVAPIFIGSWLLAIFFLLWIILLGLIDILSVRIHFRMAKDRETVEGALLKYQLKKELERSEKAVDSVRPEEENNSKGL